MAVPGDHPITYRLDPSRVVLDGGRWRKADQREQCSCCLEMIEARGYHYRADRWTVLCQRCYGVARRAS